MNDHNHRGDQEYADTGTFRERLLRLELRQIELLKKLREHDLWERDEREKWTSEVRAVRDALFGDVDRPGIIRRLDRMEQDFARGLRAFVLVAGAAMTALGTAIGEFWHRLMQQKP